MKILIIEDDKNISKLLSAELNEWGYETKEVTDFSSILKEFNDYNPNLILMDISLPFYNGYYWTQKIRALSNVPIIFISSRSEPLDMVQAMQIGADDYITKPIDIYVTRAKIQAILRRTYDYSVNFEKLVFGNILLNLSSAKLESSDFSIDLTRTELLILEQLMISKNKIATREEIINHCWQGENFIDDNTLAVNITRLRKKLSANGIPNFIKTKKGIGYFLSLEDDNE